MKTIENTLKHLYRYNCPDSLTLGEYHLHMLPAEQHDRIQAHLEACPHCRQEIAHLKTLLRSEEESPSLWDQTIQRLEVLIARYIPIDNLSPAFEVRGDPNQLHFFMVGDTGQVTLEVQPLSDGRHTLLGLMLGFPPQGFEARLFQGERLLESTRLDELGNFIFSNLLSGNYTMILARPGVEIHLQNIPV
ncbi:MAG: hypothetical protein Fur0018_04010 [Anaerolineales bacterium]